MAGPVENDKPACVLAGCRVYMRYFNCAQVFVMHGSSILYGDFRSLYRLRDTADMESSHGQLRAGFADGLGSYNAHSRSAFHKLLR